jgi:tetratricopeptide (TPR) repeat protein
MKKTGYFFPALIICFVIMSFTDLQAKKKEDTAFDKAVKYFYQNKLEMAEILLQEELKNNPENSMAYSYLGDIFLEKKRYDGALNLFKKSLDIDPGNGDNYFRVGQIYYFKKEAELAINNFQESFKLEPKLTFAYYHIGLAYLMLKRDKEMTIESWEKFLKLAPEDIQYEKIRRAIDLLRDPNFVLPPPDSDISIEEALHLGGSVMSAAERTAKEKEAGHESKKTKSKVESIYRDEDM